MQKLINFNDSSQFINASLDLDDYIMVNFEVPFDYPFSKVREFQSFHREDKLWEQTCFELFLLGDKQYIEFNMTPNGEWNCFHFDSYREGKKEFQDVDLVKLHEFEFTFDIELPFEVKKFNLCAILQETQEPLYFALKHGEKPDFHDAKNFMEVGHAHQG